MSLPSSNGKKLDISRDGLICSRLRKRARRRGLKVRGQQLPGRNFQLTRQVAKLRGIGGTSSRSVAPNSEINHRQQ